MRADNVIKARGRRSDWIVKGKWIDASEVQSGWEGKQQVKGEKEIRENLA